MGGKLKVYLGFLLFSLLASKAEALEDISFGKSLPDKMEVAPLSAYIGVLEPSLKIGILLQNWFITGNSAENPLNSPYASSTFRIRRTEIYFDGVLVPKKFTYEFMFNPARVFEMQDKNLQVVVDDRVGTVVAKQPTTPISALQNAILRYSSPYLDVAVGQMKVPLSYEGSIVRSAQLLFAERDVITQDSGYRRRDIGFTVGKRFNTFGYVVGLFNGNLINNLDNNLTKDGVIRLEAYPLPGLTLASVLYGSLGERNGQNAKERYEVDLVYQKHNFLWQAEYIQGRDVLVSGNRPNYNAGFYAQMGYKFFKVLEPAVRIGHYDPALQGKLTPAKDGKDRLWHYDFGLNYYILENNLKLCLNYLLTVYEQKAQQAQLLLAMQMFYRP